MLVYMPTPLYESQRLTVYGAGKKVLGQINYRNYKRPQTICLESNDSTNSRVRLITVEKTENLDET